MSSPRVGPEVGRRRSSSEDINLVCLKSTWLERLVKTRAVDWGHAKFDWVLGGVFFERFSRVLGTLAGLCDRFLGSLTGKRICHRLYWENWVQLMRAQEWNDDQLEKRWEAGVTDGN